MSEPWYSSPTLRQVREATTKREGLWVVLIDGREVGFLTRFANSRTDVHPWKAFHGVGESARFLGSFYPCEGGKLSALRAVLGEEGR